MNLSCAQCHDDNWGKKLGPETISQGHSVAYPIYRLEWQTMGSLHRRFRSCLSGVRAEMLPQGSPEYPGSGAVSGVARAGIAGRDARRAALTKPSTL